MAAIAVRSLANIAGSGITTASARGMKLPLPPMWLPLPVIHEPLPDM